MTLDDAWEGWLEDNREKVKLTELETIRNAYRDGFYDGKRAAEHTAVMTKLEQIAAKVGI